MVSGSRNRSTLTERIAMPVIRECGDRHIRHDRRRFLLTHASIVCTLFFIEPSYFHSRYASRCFKRFRLLSVSLSIHLSVARGHNKYFERSAVIKFIIELWHERFRIDCMYLCSPLDPSSSFVYVCIGTQRARRGIVCSCWHLFNLHSLRKANNSIAIHSETEAMGKCSTRLNNNCST